MKPVLFAAVRRGLFMEELVRASGDEQRRGEMFICGLFRSDTCGESEVEARCARGHEP